MELLLGLALLRGLNMGGTPWDCPKTLQTAGCFVLAKPADQVFVRGGGLGIVIDTGHVWQSPVVMLLEIQTAPRIHLLLGEIFDERFQTYEPGRNLAKLQFVELTITVVIKFDERHFEVDKRLQTYRVAGVGIVEHETYYKIKILVEEKMVLDRFFFF